MARTRNQKSYDDARTVLLSVGLRLIRSQSFKAVGINDVLKESGVPRGSFYHYFESKEVFGLEVAKFYHTQQIASAQKILSNSSQPPVMRLEEFFTTACNDYIRRGFADGCLMCNLSTELADTNQTFQKLLRSQWAELAGEISHCLAQIDSSEIGLKNLTNDEAADWLLNTWSGTLTRMKAEQSPAPLKLFQKTIFNMKD